MSECDAASGAEVGIQPFTVFRRTEVRAHDFREFVIADIPVVRLERGKREVVDHGLRQKPDRAIEQERNDARFGVDVEPTPVFIFLRSKQKKGLQHAGEEVAALGRRSARQRDPGRRWQLSSSRTPADQRRGTR